MIGWYGWGGGTSGPGWLGMGLMMLVFWGLVAAAVVWAVRASGRGGNAEVRATVPGARQILDELLARGELTEEEYLRRRDLLRTP